jgi:hypothetical protein
MRREIAKLRQGTGSGYSQHRYSLPDFAVMRAGIDLQEAF